MKSMNFQALDINNGLFRTNGACGYVLKPKFLREGIGTFQ